MDVTHIHDADTAGEVDVAIALDIPDFSVPGLLGVKGTRDADALGGGGYTAAVQILVLGHAFSPDKICLRSATGLEKERETGALAQCRTRTVFDAEVKF
jgi:hypothetical protein